MLHLHGFKHNVQKGILWHQWDRVLSTPSHRVCFVTGALATAKAQLPCGFDSIQVQPSLFWWYSDHSATVAAVLSVITWLSAASELVLSSPWAGEGAPGSPSEQLFSGTNSVWVTFWFWKIFCCSYLQSKFAEQRARLPNQIPAWRTVGLVLVQQPKSPQMCTQEYSKQATTEQTRSRSLLWGHKSITVAHTTNYSEVHKKLP